MVIAGYPLMATTVLAETILACDNFAVMLRKVKSTLCQYYYLH